MRGIALLCALVVLSPDGLAGQSATTLTTLSPLHVDGLLADDDGGLYGAGGYRGSKVFHVDPSGAVTVVADGLSGPVDLARDADGNLYVTNFTDASVSRITPEGTVSVFARVGEGPAGIVIDGSGNLYVACYGDLNAADGDAVYKITPEGTVTIFVEGHGLEAPVGMAVDEAGNLYAGNFYEGSVYRISPDGGLTLLATLPRPTKRGTIGHLAYVGGFLYATGIGLNRLFRIDRDGGVTEYIGDDSPIALLRPNGLTPLPDGSGLVLGEIQAGPDGSIRLRRILF